jgi:putative transposase
VTSRGNRGAAIYRDDHDHALFLSRLLGVLDRFEWDLHAWCLMTNHFHLLVTTRAATIADGMQSLKSRYAEAFNARYGLQGHLFEGRYAHRLVASETHLLNAYAYIALNPVRAEACRRPEDWYWSSYAGLVAGRTGPLYDSESMLRHFAGDSGRAELRRLVDEAYVEWRLRSIGHVRGLTPDMAVVSTPRGAAGAARPRHGRRSREVSLR